MDDDDSLIGFTNSLNEVRCSISEDSVENPLLETQFLVRIEVSTQLYQLGNINRSFADSIQINEARIPPEIVEFPLFVEEEEDQQDVEEEEDEEDQKEEEDQEDDAEEEEEEGDIYSSQTAYGDIDRLVSNSFIKLRFSQTVKNVIWNSRLLLMEIAMVEKPKWIRLTLDIEVTKIYLEFDEDDYEHIVSRVTRESFEAENENGCNAVEPASWVSIEALETKKYEKEDDLLLVVTKGDHHHQRINSCGICLDEFLKGVDFIAKMPCTHVFHKGCIFKWLQRRRTCPLCRFEMPAIV